MNNSLGECSWIMYKSSSAYFINRIVLIELQRIKQGLILEWILISSAAVGDKCGVKYNQRNVSFINSTGRT